MTGHYGWQGKRVLVTGGAGFIGSHLVEQLARAGALVTVLDDLTAGCRENLGRANGNATLFELDIRQVAWEELLRKEQYEAIFHLAANAYVPPSVERPAWDYAINLDGTFRLLEALRGTKWPGKLIYASSAAVYGNPARIPIAEDDPTVPISPYGVAKLAAERYVAVYGQLYGLKVASLRFFSVYGPRQRKQVVYDLIQKINQNPTELFLHGDGTQVRDFNYVEDAARAMMIVAENGALQGEVYNVASGRDCSIGELASSLCRVLHAQPRLLYSGSVRPGDPEKWMVDIKRLSELRYRPQVSLEEGLRRTIGWYRETVARSA
ncbi:MAG: NAD-dependent epimerase/dehydratase family protein [Chloroflexi bacterium]|nr:NAD-dependent epimerase/dehydratase family protein [Chloroflexota bacterium]